MTPKPPTTTRDPVKTNLALRTTTTTEQKRQITDQKVKPSTNKEKTQPSLLRNRKKSETVERSSPRNSKILNLKEFLARKKLEKESKIKVLKEKSSTLTAEVGVSHPATPTTHNNADSSQNLGVGPEDQNSETVKPNQTGPLTMGI